MFATEVISLARGYNSTELVQHSITVNIVLDDWQYRNVYSGFVQFLLTTFHF